MRITNLSTVVIINSTIAICINIYIWFAIAIPINVIISYSITICITI